MDSNSIRRTTWQWLPLVLWMSIIFATSHQPSGSIPDYGSWDLLVKKGGHLVGYAILAILARRAGLSVRMALALAIFYAISDELHQRQIPGRNGQLLDVFIDSVGATMGLLLYRWILPRLHGFRWDQTDMAGEQSPPDA